MNELQQKIESLLLYKNEPVSFSWLSKILDVEKKTINETLLLMPEFYIKRGITLVITDQEVGLVTNDISADILAELSKQSEEKELSKQALETLAIIGYRGMITKSEIDYIRGVNSVFILRNLMIRGLITKKKNVLDQRSPLYIPTHDMLSYLGITEITQLPKYQETQKKLRELEEEFDESQKDTEPIVVGEGAKKNNEDTQL